jgi:biotin carboxylase
VGQLQRSAGRPLVAVAYGPRSVPAVQLAEAAAPICELLWLLDLRVPETDEMATLLRRFGTLVDIGGLDVDEAAAEVGQYRPDGIVTYFDTGMVEVAVIAERLGLPFASPQTAQLLYDKLHQRDALRAAGSAVPRYWSIQPGRSATALAALPDDIVWPAVLKPRAESGSHNTFLAGGLSDLTTLLDGLGERRAEMMLEEYLSDDSSWRSSPFADYVSVESVVSHGVVSHVALTGRFPQAETFRETGFFIPADLSDSDQRAVLDITSSAIQALEVDFGCLHTEVKFTADGPRIIEVNGRVGGGIPAMLQEAAHFPMLATSLRVALGEHVVIDGPIRCPRVGYRFFLQPPAISGTVEAIDGVNRLADRPGVHTVTVHRGPGWRVDWREGTRTFVLAVVGVADDHDEVRAVWRALHEEITVSYSATGRPVGARATNP